MRLTLPNILFFGSIGFIADLFNFGAGQSEILKATYNFQATEAQLGHLGALSSLLYAISTLFCGLISERFGRRPMVLAAIITMGISYVLGALATNMHQLYGVAGMRSIGTAMLWPPVMAWMARAVPPARFSKFLGAYNLCWGTGTLISFWMAGWMAQSFGISVPFYTFSFLALLLFGFVLSTNPEGGHGMDMPEIAADGSDHHGLSDEQASRYVWQGLIMAAAGMMAAAMATYIFPKIGSATLSELKLSLLSSVRMAGQMISFFLMGRYAAWHFRRWPMVAMTLVLIAGLILMATGHNYMVYALGYLCVGVGNGAGYALCAYYALGLSKTKGKGSGMMETTIGLGGLGGSLLGGEVGRVADARIGILSGILPSLLALAISLFRAKGLKRPAQ